MESLEISAKTVEEAIQRAVEQLGVSQEELEVTVVKEGKPGILGLGAEEAVVRVKSLAPLVPKEEGDIVAAAEDTIERLLTLMGMADYVVTQAQPIFDEEQETTASVVLNVEGGDLGILIGRRGHTLDCFQYIVKLIVGQQTKAWLPIVIDVEGYKQRRYQTLRTLARNIAEQVEAKGAPFTLESMTAYERRIIHITLADHPDVTTESVGQGEARRVVIQPKE